MDKPQTKCDCCGVEIVEIFVMLNLIFTGMYFVTSKKALSEVLKETKLFYADLWRRARE